MVSYTSHFSHFLFKQFLMKLIREVVIKMVYVLEQNHRQDCHSQRK